MFCMYQDREELEDDLYGEEDGDDSEGSEVNSELEFHLYSQLHYSANAGLTEEDEDEGEKEEEGQDETKPGATQTTSNVHREQEPGGGSSRESRAPSPDVDKLLQLLEEKKKKKKEEGEKADKQKKKKKKGDPKAQRSSTCFEEVIVIDSSTDVISISEDETTDEEEEDEEEDEEEEEEGICALKGQNSNRLKTSTPAHQGSQKRRLSVPVTVDSSSSQSDSQKSPNSSSSDSSDSDDVENWMILGRGNQEGDQRISLNLEGDSSSSQDAEEEEERSWLVSSKDKEARIYNKDKGSRLTPQRVANRYYTNKSIECRNCKKNGHLSKNCPLPKKLSPCFLCGTPGHMSSECPSRHCNNCGLPGHLYSSCIDRAHWHQWCERCSMSGHSSGACPEIWRQYHITTKAGPPVRRRGEDGGRTPASCYNCSRKGHFGHDCKNKRMFNGTYPSIPFINHYDSTKDIKYREKWVKSKVKELKRHGLIPDGSQTPLTPGPPHKRQKLNHHKNNHQSNHTHHHGNQTPRHGNQTPRHGNQTPHHGNHTPHHGSGNHKRSHIFFPDSNETPKSNKSFSKQQDGGGKAKAWKPKRPVPTSRDPLPTAKVMVDEADDFPRGGGRGQDVDRKRKRKWKGFPEGHTEGRPDRLGWTVTGDMKGSGKKKWKNQKKKKKKNDKDPEAHMYPKDENLFIIKQKKRRR